MGDILTARQHAIAIAEKCPSNLLNLSYQIVYMAGSIGALMPADAKHYDEVYWTTMRERLGALVMSLLNWTNETESYIVFEPTESVRGNKDGIYSLLLITCAQLLRVATVPNQMLPLNGVLVAQRLYNTVYYLAEYLGLELIRDCFLPVYQITMETK